MLRFIRAAIALLVVIVQVLPALPVQAQEFQDPNQGGFVLPDFYIENILIDFASDEARIIVGFEDHDREYNEGFAQDKLLTIQTGWQQRDAEGNLQGQRYVDMHTLRLDTGLAEPLGNNRWVITDRRDFANYDIYGGNAYIATIARIDHGANADRRFVVGDEFNRNNSQVISMEGAQDEYMRGFLNPEDDAPVEEEPGAFPRPDAAIESYTFDREEGAMTIVMSVDQALPEGVRMQYSSLFINDVGRGVAEIRYDDVLNTPAFQSVGENRWEITAYGDFDRVISGEYQEFSAYVSLSPHPEHWQISDPNLNNDFLVITGDMLVAEPAGQPDPVEEREDARRDELPFQLGNIAGAIDADLDAARFGEPLRVIQPDVSIAGVNTNPEAGTVTVLVTSDVPVPDGSKIDYFSYWITAAGEEDDFRFVDNGIQLRAEQLSPTQWRIIEHRDFAAIQSGDNAQYHFEIGYVPPRSAQRFIDPNESNNFVRMSRAEVLNLAPEAELGTPAFEAALVLEPVAEEPRLFVFEPLPPSPDLLVNIRDITRNSQLGILFNAKNVGDVALPENTTFTRTMEWIRVEGDESVAQGEVVGETTLEPLVLSASLIPFRDNREVGNINREFTRGATFGLQEAFELGATHGRFRVSFENEDGLADPIPGNNVHEIELALDISITHNEEPWLGFNNRTLYFPDFHARLNAGALNEEDQYFDLESIPVNAMFYAFNGGLIPQNEWNVFLTRRNEAGVTTWRQRDDRPNLALPFQRQRVSEIDFGLNTRDFIGFDGDPTNNRLRYSVASDLGFAEVEFFDNGTMIFNVRNQRASLMVNDDTTIDTVFSFFDVEGNFLGQMTRENDFHVTPLAGEAGNLFIYEIASEDVPTGTAIVRYVIDAENTVNDLWPLDNQGQFFYDAALGGQPDLQYYAVQRTSAIRGQFDGDGTYAIYVINRNPRAPIERNPTISYALNGEDGPDANPTISFEGELPTTVLGNDDPNRNLVQADYQMWVVEWNVPGDALLPYPTKDFRLMIDPENRYAESNEDNNIIADQYRQLVDNIDLPDQVEQRMNDSAREAEQDAAREEFVGEHEAIREERERREAIRLLPGDTFYPVKELYRSARSFFAFNPEQKVALEAEFAFDKVDELLALEERDEEPIDPEIVEKIVEELFQIGERVEELPDGDKEEPTLLLLDSVHHLGPLFPMVEVVDEDKDVTELALALVESIDDPVVQGFAAEDTFKRLVPKAEVKKRVELAKKMDDVVSPEAKKDLHDAVSTFVAHEVDKRPALTEKDVKDLVADADNKESNDVSEFVLLHKIEKKISNDEKKQVVEAEKEKAAQKVATKEDDDILLKEIGVLDEEDKVDIIKELEVFNPALAEKVERAVQTTLLPEVESDSIVEDQLGDDKQKVESDAIVESDLDGDDKLKVESDAIVENDRLDLLKVESDAIVENKADLLKVESDAIVESKLGGDDKVKVESDSIIERGADGIKIESDAIIEDKSDLLKIESDAIIESDLDGDDKQKIESDAIIERPKVEIPDAVTVEPIAGNCDDVYAPVCGADGKTFSNSCQAELNKATILYEGECNPVDFIKDTCPAERVPVCGIDGQTYKNECTAERFGVKVQSPGECVVKTSCPDTKDPVCDITGVTHQNSCFAEEVGLPYSPGACGSTDGLF